VQIQIAVARQLQRDLDIARTERLTIWAHNRGWSGGIDPGRAAQNRNGDHDRGDDQTDMAFLARRLWGLTREAWVRCIGEREATPIATAQGL